MVHSARYSLFLCFLYFLVVVLHFHILSSTMSKDYSHSTKPWARSCGHFIHVWDNHPYCISCQLWAEGGGQKGYLPCIRDQCADCQYWSEVLRSDYRLAILKRIKSPLAFGPGKKYVENCGFAAPKEILEVFGLPITPFRVSSRVLSSPSSSLDSSSECDFWSGRDIWRQALGQMLWTQVLCG